MSIAHSYVLLEPRPQAVVRILCFHHAGGSAWSLVPLIREMSSSGEVLLFELPGRGLTSAVPFLGSFAEIKAYFWPDVLEALDRPAILLGHSLGGLIVHSLACSLPPEKQRLVQRVIVSGARSPEAVARAATYPSAPFLARTREHLIQDLMAFGGTPPEILANPELVEYMITLLGHDLHLIDTYTEQKSEEKTFPLEIWSGRDDPAVPPSGVALWDKATPAPIKIRIFEGNHFYLFSNQKPALVLRDLVHTIGQQQVS